MKFQIDALNRETGEPASFVPDAEDERDALAAVSRLGCVVDKLVPIPPMDQPRPHMTHAVDPPARRDARQVAQFKVVPFVAVVNSSGQGPHSPAQQLESLIRNEAGEGWEYVRLENLETIIAGDSGCFGIGATPSRTTTFSMAVFRRN